MTVIHPRNRTILAAAGKLLICGLLTGVVVAAAFFPAVALTGLTAKAGGEAFGQLPDELTVKRNPQISYVYAADNKTLVASMYDENRRDLPLSAIPLVMQDAILAAEDQKFYEHNGVDIKGFGRAFFANQTAGEVQQGASTITMQLVRMSISYSADTPEEVIQATEDTNARKLREIRYALALEQRISKAQILENYLNTAYFGTRAYGIFAASQVYFDKEPSDLEIHEAAFLAGLPKFPGSLDDPEGMEAATGRRDYIITEMAQMGAITPVQAAEAKATEPELVRKSTPNGCVQATTNHWGFFCDFLQRWWLEQEVFGVTEFDRERQLRSGGYRIVSSLDVKIQQIAKDNVEEVFKTGHPHAAMLAAVEPGSGKVRALAANRNFKLDDRNDPQNGKHSNPAAAAGGRLGSYPNTTNPLLAPAPGFQGYRPGSVMKFATMLAALENGFPLDYTINVVDRYKSNYPHRGTPNCGGYWCPPNWSGSPKGPQNMWSGFGSSVNNYFVPLFDHVGGDKVMDMARRVGLKFYDRPGTPDDDYGNSTDPWISKRWAPFTLGISTHTPLEIANMFATAAADGLYCEPIPVESITNLKGEKLDVGNPRCTQAIDKNVARAAIDAARCPIGDQSFYNECRGTTARAAKDAVGKPIAGKTGTSDGSRTATLTITTKQLAVSGFLADPDWPETNKQMQHNGPDGINPAVWNTLAGAMKGKPGVEFSKPTAKVAYGTQVSVPDVACKSLDEAANLLKKAGLVPMVSDEEPVESACAAGTAAGTNPSGRVPKGSAIAITVSNGALVPEPEPTKPPDVPPPPDDDDDPIELPICPPNCDPGRP